MPQTTDRNILNLSINLFDFRFRYKLFLFSCNTNETLVKSEAINYNITHGNIHTITTDLLMPYQKLLLVLLYVLCVCVFF